MLVAALVAVVVLAPAQGGYRTAKLPELGIELPVPRRYEPIPVQPTETLVVRKWVGEPAKETRYRYERRPEVLLAVLPAVKAPDGRTRSGGEGTIEGFFEDRYSGERASWLLGPREGLDPEESYACHRYPVKAKGLFLGRRGVAYTWRNAERTVCLIGFCVEEDFKKQEKIWRHMARKLELSEPAAAGDSKWDRYYARRDQFKDPAFRIRLRASLPRGWKADDTENYIFLYSTKDEKLLRILKRELEAIREAYLERFPPQEEIRAVSAVRVCKDKAEYQSYGGSARSAGYWHPIAKELVFYDQGKGEGREDSRIVLYHEAFHQYIYYCAGEVAPHSWFNEGHGDYFSGARFSRTGDIARIGTNPWRLGYVKHLIDRGQHRPFTEILYLDKARFYADAARCYSQAWSIVYFLRESREVRQHPRWSTILPAYFETLKATFEEGVYALEEAAVADPEAPGPEDEEALAQVKEAAREAAIEAALADVDLWALEEAWLDFMADLKP